MKYSVFLFKNKERKKLLKSFKTLKNTETFFEKKIEESNTVVFDKKIENGLSVNFEIGIVEFDSSDFESYFVKDDLGRNVKIEVDDLGAKITKIATFKVEELLFDLTTNKKISFNTFYKKYLSGNNIKVISKINNKFFIQDDDDFYLFSLKSESDCFRFFDILENYLYSKNKTNIILVTDSTKQQKKYLYSLLESKGISKKILYKQSTTFFRDK